HGQRPRRGRLRAQAQGPLGGLFDGRPRLLLEGADRLPVRRRVRDARSAAAGDRRPAHQLRKRGSGSLLDQRTRMKPKGILGQAGPLMLGRGGATVLGFALPLILTRLLPQAEFGTYKQVWLVVSTAYLMLQLGMA